MPEPLGGLEGPVGPEEPGDDACTGQCQRLFETDVLSRVRKMLVQKKTTKATNETMIAFVR